VLIFQPAAPGPIPGGSADISAQDQEKVIIIFLYLCLLKLTFEKQIISFHKMKMIPRSFCVYNL
jgi:hypothetical protein